MHLHTATKHRNRLFCSNARQEKEVTWKYYYRLTPDKIICVAIVKFALQLSNFVTLLHVMIANYGV